MMQEVVLLVTLPGVVSQPEVIREAQAEGNNGDSNHQEPASERFLAKFLGLLGSALGQLGGGLW